MSVVPVIPVAPTDLREGRFARLEAIEWWNQARIREARVLVVGAGALGNEVIKNLALLGVGNVVVTDLDHVEMSNLSRSVLFRETDEGRPKAECAARAAHAIYPDMNVLPLTANVLSDVGLGYFRWSDAVIGALDNREARVFVNAACARTGRPWIDGGIEVLRGVARGFAPPQTACYECTMSQVDWDLLNKRRSCSLLARRALAQRGVPTTPTTASIIAALQVQEMVKSLHGMQALLGRGFVFDGATHSSYVTDYPISPDCPWHEPPAPIMAFPEFSADTPLQRIWDEAARRLGGLDALDFARELVRELVCDTCRTGKPVWQSVDKITEDQAVCAQCGAETRPELAHSLGQNDPALAKTARELGLPRWEILWARHGDKSLGLELAGDCPFPNQAKLKQEMNDGR